MILKSGDGSSPQSFLSPYGFSLVDSDFSLVFQTIFCLTYKIGESTLRLCSLSINYRDSVHRF